MIRLFGPRRRVLHEPDIAFAAFLRDQAAAMPEAGPLIATVSFGHVAGPQEPFPFYAAVALLSARRLHPAARLLLFCEHEPHGIWWERVCPHVRWCPSPRFRDLDHALTRQAEGRMLLVRLMVLRALGGMFASTDMLVLRGMDDLACHPMVLGAQASAPVSRFAFGMGLALARPGNELCQIWLDACLMGEGMPLYDLACRLPVRLYAQAPSRAHVLPHTAWFAPVSQRIRNVLFHDDPDRALRLCKDSLALPLWSDMLKEVLETWTPQTVVESDCLFSRLCARVLPDLQCEVRDIGVSASLVTVHGD